MCAFSFSLSLHVGEERIPVSLLLPLPPSLPFPGEDEHEKKEERGKERGIGLASLRRRSRWGGSIVFCVYILSVRPRAQEDKWRDFPPPDTQGAGEDTN